MKTKTISEAKHAPPAYGLDAWGNLNSIAATTNSNYTGCTEESGFSTTADTNNHFPIFGYDLSGNTQSDSTISYTYDAESQIKTAAGVTYLYDGSGRRVSKSSGKLYWYGSGGEILAETTATGATLNEYIFFAGKRVALLPAGGNAEYYAEDLLGSSRVTTTNTGTVCYDADFYPYGGERAYTNSCPLSNVYKFEGKERDTETGNDDFGARYYSNRFGRWLSADWSSTPVAVPYANLTNPQTLNLYAMVSDDPESTADLDGHQQQQSQGLNESGCAAAGGGSSANGSCARQPNSTASQTQNQQQAEAAQKRARYGSIDAAAAAAQTEARNQPNADKVEYGGRIYKNDDGTYSSTTPVTQNNPKGVDLPEVQQNTVGDYHTHPSGSAEAEKMELPDRLSAIKDAGDVRVANGQKRDLTGQSNYSSYVGAPSGKMMKFTPDTRAKDGLGTFKEFKPSEVRKLSEKVVPQ
jgi:RHS repeat-associated protein